MHSRRSLVCALVTWTMVAGLFRAQDNPLEDPDLKQALKQAQELQKQMPVSGTTKKKLADLQAQAKEDLARQEAEENREKEKLQAALNKQLQAPGPVVLPEWTPTTPQFKANGAPTRKIVDEEVRIIQTGTSPLSPKQLADGWEAAAVAAKNLNHGRNNIESNGKLTTIMFLSTRSEPLQEVKLKASREPEDKTTQIEISSPLPKPDIDSE